MPRRASSSSLPLTPGSADPSGLSHGTAGSPPTSRERSASSADADATLESGGLSGFSPSLSIPFRRRTTSAGATGSPAQPVQNLADELYQATGSPSSIGQQEEVDGVGGILGGDVVKSPSSQSSSDAVAAVRGGGSGDGDGDRKNDNVQDGDELPFRTPVRTVSRASLLLSPINEDEKDAEGSDEEVEGEPEVTPGIRAPNDLARVQMERRTMLDPLYIRIRDGGLAVNVGTIESLRFDAQDQPVWQPIDIERYTAERIEAFRQELDHPANGAAPAPLEVRNRVTAQMHALAAGIKGLVTNSVARHVALDTAFIRNLIVDLTRQLQAPQPAPSRASAPVPDLDPFTSPPQAPQLTSISCRQSRLTMQSNTSSPEPVFRGFDRATLRMIPQAELVNIIMRQEQYQNEREQDVENQLEQHEVEVESLRTREVELTQENERATRELRRAEAAVLIAHDHGLNGLNIDGTRPATPREADARGRRGQELDPGRARDGNPPSPVAKGSEEGRDAVPATPLHRREGADGPSDSDARPPDVPGDDIRQDFDDLQALIVALDEEDIMSMRYISHSRHEALRATIEAEVARAAAAAEAAPGTDASASNRTSTAGSGGMTREQLQTRLRMAEEERDALLAERDQYHAEEATREDDELDNLSPNARQRIADVSERSMRFFSRFLRQFSRCSRMTSAFAQTMVDVGRINRGRGSQQVREALRIVLNDGARITAAEPAIYDQEPGIYGQFEHLQWFQDQWLPQVQIFFDHFIELFSDLEVLRARVHAWDDTNPRNERGQMLDDLRNGGSQRQSTSSASNQSLLSRAASGISGLLFGSEQDQPHERPLYTEPEWARLHPNDAPCVDCVPVLRFPADIFQGTVDPGPCTCGHGAMVEPRSASTRSRHSAASRVSFADVDGPPAPASNAASPRSTRGILRKSPRGPAPLDVELANADAGSDVSTRPGTPHPSRTLSAGRPAADARRPSALPVTSSRDVAAPQTVQPVRPRTPARRHTVVQAPSFAPDELPKVSPPIDRHFVESPPIDRPSTSSAASIIQPRKPCCAHFDEASRLCECGGGCEDHWCCDHWQDTLGCRCTGTCENHQCCDCWDSTEGDGMCMCFSSCGDHRKCCSCGVTYQDDGTTSCNCGGTCHHHAVCDHYTPDSLNLACMAGCPLFSDAGKCGHPDIRVHGGTTIPSCRQPCESHPCCEHWTAKDGRAYCDCGKGCNVHRCCDHYDIFSNRVCGCRGSCEAHVPLNIRERRRRNVTALASAAPENHLFAPPAQDFNDPVYSPGGAPDWKRTMRRDERRMRKLGILDASGNIIPENDRPLVNTLPRRRQGRLSQESNLSRVAPTTMDAPAACGCSCRCRTGGRQNILSAGDGPGFAYFTCMRMLGQGDPAPSEHSVPDGETDPFVETLQDVGTEEPATPPRPSGSRHTGPSSASSVSRVSRASQVSRAPSGRPGGASPSDRPAQDIAEPPARGLETPPSVPAVGLARRRSDRPPQRPRRTPPQTPTHSDRGPVSPVGLNQGGEDTIEPIRDRGAREQEDEGGREDNEDPAEPPEVAPQNDQREDEQRDEPQGEQQANEPHVAEVQPAEGQLDDGGRRASVGRPTVRRASTGQTGGQPGGGPPDGGLPDGGPPDGGPPGGGGGVPGPQQPHAPGPEPQLPDPREQLLWLMRIIICFLTWGQVYNIWRILQYLVGLVYYAGRRNVDRFRRLRGQPALRAWAPVLPTSEIFQLAMWLALAWFSVSMIAISEERRLWLAANPRTASYMRGLRYRKPYPWWSPFEVDYALLEPGFDWVSIWLHRAVFRPGLGSMLGLEEHQWAEAVGNATWLAWAGVPLVAVM